MYTYIDMCIYLCLHYVMLWIMKRGIHVRVGAMEEEAIGCDEVSAEG